MRVGKGYNSAVEYHLDVVEVISSSLIIPKPNVSSFIKFFFFLRRNGMTKMELDISIGRYTNCNNEQKGFTLI
jgi:hypothetical protein